MRTSLLSLLLPAIATLATTSAAQIKLSAYSSTYNRPQTRGFYFVAPTQLVVTHLQVPDEKPSSSAADGQMVALYKLTALTTYPTTTQVTPAFYRDSVPSGQRIAVVPPVVYNKGELVAVLGGMGQTSGSVRNSYGAGSVASNVLGQPITLYRTIFQANIATVKGVGGLSTGGGSIARVRMWVAGHGSAEQYGTGSTSATLDYSDVNPPTLGGTGGVVINSTDTNNTASALSIGLLRVNTPSPFNGNFLSAPSLVLLLHLTPVPGSGRLITFPLPNNPALAGVKLTMQAGVGAAAGPLNLTNGMEWVLN